MPRGDRTGPMGYGPMTGRAAGFCAGYNMPGYMNPWGRGFFGFRGWFGRGGGRGWRHWYYATGLPGWARAAYGQFPMSPFGPDMTDEDEMAMLQEQADILKQQLDDIQKRINSLEKNQSNKEE